MALTDKSGVIFPGQKGPGTMFHSPSGLIAVADLVFGPPAPRMPGPPPHRVPISAAQFNKAVQFPTMRTIFGGMPGFNSSNQQQN